MILLLSVGLAQVEHPWGSWKEGATVAYRITTASGKEKTVQQRTLTVLRADGKTCVVRSQLRDGGQSEETHHLDGGAAYHGIEKATQEITVDGVRMTCTVFEQADRGLGGSSVRLRWVCKNPPFPGGVAKEDYEGDVGNNTIKSSLRVVRLKASLKVKGKDLVCWVTESVSSDAVSKTTTKTWHCREIPGWLVRQETRVETGGVPATETREAISWEVR